MLEASNWKTMKSWYQNLFPYENDKEFPPRGGKKDPPGTDRVNLLKIENMCKHSFL